MLRSDADSGRSSCSAGSASAPIGAAVRRNTREASTNTDLLVQDQSRTQAAANPHRLLSPAHLFPANRHHLTASHCDLYRPSTSNMPTIAPRKGGLTNAFSTIDLISSTKIEHQFTKHDIAGVKRRDHDPRRAGPSRLKVRRQPVQRVASRLYRSSSVDGQNSDMCIGPEFIIRATHPSKKLDIANSAIPGERRTVIVILLNGQKIDVVCDPSTATAGEVFQAIIQLERFEHNFMLGVSALIGGDFVFLPDDYRIRKVAPENWCGYSTLRKKHINKTPAVEDEKCFTLFLRIKFFMPANLSKAVRGGAWRTWVYLQLRRSVVEGQITLQLPQLIELTGYALQVEFGNYSPRDHASGDYYVLDHYLPEGSLSADDKNIRLLVKKAHEEHYNQSIDEAREKFIAIVQTFKDYGSHFYTAIWATRDGFARDVWLTISPRGMILYSRNTCITALPRDTHVSITSSRVLLKSLAWQHIHTLYYNKRTLYVIPNDKAGHGNTARAGLKLKLKMDLNKSYFTFYLASLHHRFYMRLHADINSLLNISDEFSIPLDGSDSGFKPTPVNPSIVPKQRRQDVWINECSNFQDSYNLAVRGQYKNTNINIKGTDNQIEELQNKENEQPMKMIDASTSDKDIWSADPKSLDSANLSSSEVLSSPESCSLPRRMGVKMGTRAFNGSNHSTVFHHKQFHSLDATNLDQINRLKYSPERLVQSDNDLVSNHSDSDEPAGDQKYGRCFVNSMNILPHRNYKGNVNKSSGNLNSAYIIESPQVNNNTFLYNSPNDETLLNSTLHDKLNSMGCVQSERCFKTVQLVRDANGALGMQVAEGSDGNVYVKSITPNGPAHQLKQIHAGDQIISVNGQTLLNLNYNRALNMLQNAPKNVEIIVLQTVITNDSNKSHQSYRAASRSASLSSDNIVAKLLSGNSFSKLSLYNNASSSSTTNLNKPMMANRNVITENQPQKKDEALNVEALKTINVLLALTKRNLERKTNCNVISENNNVEMDSKTEYVSDSIQYSSSTESTPSKKPNRSKHHSFSLTHDSKTIKRRPLSVHIPSDANMFDAINNSNDTDSSFGFRTRSCDNITVLNANNSTLNSSNSLGRLKLSPTKNMISESSKNVQFEPPKNAVFSRKWAGRLKYPVTPSKAVTGKIDDSNRFVYGNSLSDEEQIFI